MSEIDNPINLPIILIDRTPPEEENILGRILSFFGRKVQNGTVHDNKIIQEGVDGPSKVKVVYDSKEFNRLHREIYGPDV